MSKQSFSEESNWKHKPDAEHIERDKFGKGEKSRNWKKNLDQKLEARSEEESDGGEVSPDSITPDLSQAEEDRKKH